MDDRLTVFQFVHHFLTHTIVWEVWETDYASIEDTREGMARGMSDCFFTGNDDKVYMVNWPHFTSRERAEDYVRTADDSYTKYEVVIFN